MNSEYIKKIQALWQEVLEGKKKLDPVGKADADIDNDGDVDSSDEYLHKRRKAISQAMKKEDVELEEAAGNDIAAKMMHSKTMKPFASKVAKMANVSVRDLERMLPDYVSGGEIRKMFSEPGNEELGKEIETYAKKHGGIDKKDMLKVAMMLKKGDRKGAVKYTRGLDTDPREWLLDKMDAFDEAVELEAVDMDTKSVDKALSHDCAKHVASEQWGFGECIPGQHTLVEQEDGNAIVTHYDIMFEHGIEFDVPVEDLTILVSESHKHTAKKMKEGDMSKDKASHDTGGFRISNQDAQAAKKRLADRLKQRRMKKEDVSEGFMDDYKAMKAKGKSDAAAIEVMLGMPKYRKMSRDQLAKKIGDEKRKGIFKEGSTYGERTKGAANAETMKDQRKGKGANDMAADLNADNPELAKDDAAGHEDATKAGRAVKGQAPTRPGEKRVGDKNIVNPVKGAVTSTTGKEG